MVPVSWLDSISKGSEGNQGSHLATIHRETTTFDLFQGVAEQSGIVQSTTVHVPRRQHQYDDYRRLSVAYRPMPFALLKAVHIAAITKQNRNPRLTELRLRQNGKVCRKVNADPQDPTH